MLADSELKMLEASEIMLSKIVDKVDKLIKYKATYNCDYFILSKKILSVFNEHVKSFDILLKSKRYLSLPILARCIIELYATYYFITDGEESDKQNKTNFFNNYERLMYFLNKHQFSKSKAYEDVILEEKHSIFLKKKFREREDNNGGFKFEIKSYIQDWFNAILPDKKLSGLCENAYKEFPDIFNFLSKLTHQTPQSFGCFTSEKDLKIKSVNDPYWAGYCTFILLYSYAYFLEIYTRDFLDAYPLSDTEVKDFHSLQHEWAEYFKNK